MQFRAMLVTLQLANQVRRLARQNMTVEQIARHLGLPEQAIMDVLTMLGLPLPGEVDQEPLPPIEAESRATASPVAGKLVQAASSLAPCVWHQFGTAPQLLAKGELTT